MPCRSFFSLLSVGAYFEFMSKENRNVSTFIHIQSLVHARSTHKWTQGIGFVVLPMRISAKEERVITVNWGELRERNVAQVLFSLIEKKTSSFFFVRLHGYVFHEHKQIASNALHISLVFFVCVLRCAHGVVLGVALNFKLHTCAISQNISHRNQGMYDGHKQYYFSSAIQIDVFWWKSVSSLIPTEK